MAHVNHLRRVDVGVADAYTDSRSLPIRLYAQDNLVLSEHTLAVTVQTNDTINTCEVGRVFRDV
jgi:hypothetical protein